MLAEFESDAQTTCHCAKEILLPILQRFLICVDEIERF
jgi:hypothetical protein